MPITVTGKTSDYLITKDSHYACTQAYRARLSPEFANDLFGIKTNLNRIEQFLGIEESVYTHNLLDPRDAKHPHLIVAIGGDVNNVGTLREAIDRVRLSGGAPVWTWYTVPSIADLRDRFHSPKNALSVAAILEMKLALGRLSNAGPVAVKYLGFRQWYIVPDRDAPGIPGVTKGQRSLAVWPSGERFEPTSGQLTDMAIFEVLGKSATYGTVHEEYRLHKRNATWPDQADADPLIDDWKEIKRAGVTAFFEETDNDATGSGIWIHPNGGNLGYVQTLGKRHKIRSAENQYKSGYVGLPVFDTSTPDDAGATLEDIERAFPTLWEIGGASGSTITGGGFDPGVVRKDDDFDWAFVYAATANTGPAGVRTSVVEGVSTTEEHGSWEMVFTQPRIGAFLIPDTPDGVEGVWMPCVPGNVQTQLKIDGPDSMQNFFNLPFRGDAQVNGKRFNQGFVQGFPVNFERAVTTSVPGASARGTATWMTSNLDPTTEGIDWDFGDPNDLETYRENEIAAYEQLLENLFGGEMGEAWNGVDPPKRYVWAHVSGYPGGEIMDLTLGSNNGALEIDNTMRQFENAVIDRPGELDADERTYTAYKFGAGSQGTAVQSRNVCNIGFPSYTGTGGQWLYWTGLVDENGDSPLAEAVKRGDA